MKTAEKKVTESKVTDNGQMEQESVIEKINSRIESTTKQYEESVKRSTQLKQQFDQEIDLQRRCLGALEISNNLKEELEPKQDVS